MDLSQRLTCDRSLASVSICIANHIPTLYYQPTCTMQDLVLQHDKRLKIKTAEIRWLVIHLTTLWILPSDRMISIFLNSTGKLRGPGDLEGSPLLGMKVF